MSTFKVFNLGKVLANIEKAGKEIDKKAAKALTDEGNEILKKSMEQCPVATGTLRRSGTVNNPKTKAGEMSVEIGYHTDYAGPVHENMEASHPVGKAKFLEDPVNEALPTFTANVKKRMGGI